MVQRAFSQVNVFSSTALGGNPVAVVHDGDGLPDDTMAAFARWTNLSETTFLLAPTTPGADYRLRIFTPGGELPFAGHPTLGSAHAWLAARGEHATDRMIVQECAAGLITLRVTASAIAFAAPALVRSGPIAPAELALITASLGIGPADIVASNWVDNGPGWAGLLLRDAALVHALTPDFAAMAPFKVGVIGAFPADPLAGGSTENAPAFEVRAFAPTLGSPEDPVTGSLNAGLAQWLQQAGHAPSSYVAAQGTVLGRRGRVHVDRIGDEVWIGGNCTTVVSGAVDLG